jgi:hypothetical protein
VELGVAKLVEDGVVQVPDLLELAGFEDSEVDVSDTSSTV